VARVGSLPDALGHATPSKNLPGACGTTHAKKVKKHHGPASKAPDSKAYLHTIRNPMPEGFPLPIDFDVSHPHIFLDEEHY
jgi:hypothetical protein